MSERKEAIKAGYDKISGKYAEEYFNELDSKPIDRELLDGFAEQVRALGPVCDLGCGPGQIARYLSERGVEACGIDLSPRMVEQARRLSPEIEFKQGDMMALDVEDDTFGGMAAFYSIIHVPREKVVDVLRELKRVLRPGGLLLLAFHIGEGEMLLEEAWEEEVSIDYYFFTQLEMEGYLRTAGFKVERSLERAPYEEDVEYQSRRAYIFARKPAGGAY